ncbi:MAG: hypothetical protein KDA24_03985 [Deltaproteobacteria bacterium]|nr:hypothetical protein [Deltaproteobacteria bacterium]
MTVVFDSSLFRSKMSGRFHDCSDGWRDHGSSKSIGYRDPDDHDLHYWTWFPDHTDSRNEDGLFLYMKIDHDRHDPKPDDHAALMLFFDGDARLVAASAVIQMKNEDPVAPSDLTTGSPGEIPALLQQGLESASSFRSNYSESNDGRQNLPSVIRWNAELAAQSVTRQ